MDFPLHKSQQHIHLLNFPLPHTLKFSQIPKHKKLKEVKTSTFPPSNHHRPPPDHRVPPASFTERAKRDPRAKRDLRILVFFHRSFFYFNLHLLLLHLLTFDMEGSDSSWFSSQFQDLRISLLSPQFSIEIQAFFQGFKPNSENTKSMRNCR